MAQEHDTGLDQAMTLLAAVVVVAVAVAAAGTVVAGERLERRRPRAVRLGRRRRLLSGGARIAMQQTTFSDAGRARKGGRSESSVKQGQKGQPCFERIGERQESVLEIWGTRRD